MNKFAITAQGTNQVLRYKNENGKYTLTTEENHPLYTMDKNYLLDRALKEKGDGGVYTPYFDKSIQGKNFSIVKIETTEVVSKITQIG